MTGQTRKRLVLALRLVVSVGLLVFVVSMINFLDTVTFTDDDNTTQTVTGEILNRDQVKLGDPFTVRIRDRQTGNVVEVPRHQIVGGLDRVSVTIDGQTTTYHGIVLNRSSAAEDEALKIQPVDSVLDGPVLVPRTGVTATTWSDLEGIDWGVLYIAKNLTWWLAILAVIPFFIPPVATALRWRLLLAAQGIHISPTRAIRLTWVGLFFNNVSLGLTGGDVVKAYYASRETDKRTEAVLTVLIDRVLGIYTMLLLAAVMCVFIMGRPGLGQLAWSVIAVAIVAVLGTLVAFSWKFRLLLKVRTLLQKLPGSSHLLRIDRAVFLYRDHPGTLLAGVALSLASQASMFFGMFLLSRSMGIDVPMVYFFIFPPIVTILSSLPINVGGWGVGEWLYAQFFALVAVGASPAISLSILYRLTQSVLVSLPGAFMMPASRPSAEVMQAELEGTGGQPDEEPT